MMGNGEKKGMRGRMAAIFAKKKAEDEAASAFRLWPVNAAALTRFAKVMKVPPAWVLNRLIEMAINDVLSSGLRKMFEQSALIVAGVIPDVGAIAEEMEKKAAEEKAKGERPAEAEKSSLSSEERLHRQRVLAGMEAAICPKCRADARAVGETIEDLRYECDACGFGVKVDPEKVAADEGAVS
jgi:Zn ribbon nucleic-acid-binding protein